ncbi:Membrane-bound metallopeptidase [Gordonia paraffinivorans]|uniref:Membrane-bound metallopeptidase n=2 Tax=Gordonia paraffinivorans TaxID=175628 RepID=A0ABD7UYB0_9ACTN|nr:Membrane-bound metallopeptidase [Gordonia paraffinivorans]
MRRFLELFKFSRGLCSGSWSSPDVGSVHDPIAAGALMSRLEEIADELYGLTPDRFVARRNELAKEARSEGDRKLAKAVSGLRRPTQSAWAVNQWVRADPDGCGLIAELAADLTAAQRRSDVGAIRSLSTRRKVVVAASARGVVDTADGLGVTLSENMIREVVQTLRAAIADRDTLDLLRRGRLTSSVEYSGFGPAGVFVVPDPASDTDDTEATDTAPDDTGPDDTPPDDDAEADDAEADEAAARRRELEERLARAESGEQEARDDLTEASSAVDEASSEVDELARRARELREQLSRVEDELRFARQRLSAAERGRSEAKAALREAIAEAGEVRAALADLD